jgi:hypothetical protein
MQARINYMQKHNKDNLHAKIIQNATETNALVIIHFNSQGVDEKNHIEYAHIVINAEEL